MIRVLQEASALVCGPLGDGQRGSVLAVHETQSPPATPTTNSLIASRSAPIALPLQPSYRGSLRRVDRRYIFFHGKATPGKMERGANRISEFVSRSTGGWLRSTQNRRRERFSSSSTASPGTRYSVVGQRVSARSAPSGCHSCSPVTRSGRWSDHSSIPRLTAVAALRIGAALLECRAACRVQDVDFGTNQIPRRGAKGATRTGSPCWPAAIKADLIRHLTGSRAARA